MKPLGWELSINCWKPGQRQRKLLHLKVSGSFLKCHHQGAFRYPQSHDTSNMPPGSVYLLIWVLKGQFILSPSSYNLREWTTHSKLEIVILKWCKKLKIMKNIWVQISGNVSYLIQRLLVGRKSNQDRVYIRNSCSTQHISPRPPAHPNPGEALTHWNNRETKHKMEVRKCEVIF